MFRLKDYRDANRSYGDLLGWFGLVADGVIETYDGHFLASFYFRGEDLASSSINEMAQLSARLNSVLVAKLDGRWALHVDSIRKYTRGYSEQGAFPDPTTRLIDEERRMAYEEEGQHLETTHALTLSWEVPRLMGAKVESWIFGEGDEVAATMDKASHHDRMLEKFQRDIREIEAALSSVVQARRMKAYVRGQDAQGRDEIYDEQLEYFEFCATGRSRPVRLPPVPVYLDRRIGEVGIQTEKLIGLTGFSTGNVVRLGESLLVRAMTISGFPSASSPALLSVLDSLSFEYRWHTRYLVMEQHVAEAVLNKEKRKWDQKKRPFIDQMKGRHDRVDPDAHNMSTEVAAAIAEVKSNLMRYGHYTSTIVVSDTSGELLAEKCQLIENELRNRGFDVIQEEIGNADAFIGTMPGNRIANVRGGPISTLVLADLLPLTSVWAGSEFHPSPLYPHNSPPLLYAATTGATPFRLNLHVDDVGHTLILGPTGAGKTTLLNTVIAQHFRYPNARVFGFDRKYGCYVLCKASGGSYFDIGGPSNSPSFAPLADVETSADRAWAVEWLETCCVLQLGQDAKISPGQRASLFTAVNQLVDNRGGKRSLTALISLVQDPTLREALQHYSLAGPMGQLLDAEDDSLKVSNFAMFEMEHLAGSGDKNLIPVMLYLFRQLDKRLDGSPTFVPLDESWLMLDHPMFRAKLQEWLKTWRSKNAYVALATQEPADVLKSQIRDVVLASCPTRILLANSDATGVQREMYDLLQCNDTEVEIIARARKRRDYYYKSPVGRRLFTLGLMPVTLAFVGASSKPDVALAKKLEAEFGERWPAEWLRRREDVHPGWGDHWEKQL